MVRLNEVDESPILQFKASMSGSALMEHLTHYNGKLIKGYILIRWIVPLPKRVILNAWITEIAGG